MVFGGALHILIVDDSEDDAELLTLTIHKLYPKIKVTSCRSIKAARDVLRDEPVDLVLIDMKMPGEIYSDIFKDMKQYIPVVLVTGMNDDESDSFRATNINYPRFFAKKPVTEEKLERLMNFLWAR